MVDYPIIISGLFMLGGVLYKTYTSCLYSVNSGTVALVYDTHRNVVHRVVHCCDDNSSIQNKNNEGDEERHRAASASLHSSSAPPMFTPPTQAHHQGESDHHRQNQRKKSFVMPPFPNFKVFYIPEEILDQRKGAELVCRVEEVMGIPSNNCTNLLDFEMSIRYCIDVRELNRYLTINGADKPNKSIASVVANVVRKHAVGQDISVLVSPSSRGLIEFDQKLFMELRPMLIVYACVNLLECQVVKVTDHNNVDE